MADNAAEGTCKDCGCTDMLCPACGLCPYCGTCACEEEEEGEGGFFDGNCDPEMAAFMVAQGEVCGACGTDLCPECGECKYCGICDCDDEVVDDDFPLSLEYPDEDDGPNYVEDAYANER
jgi:hypothetical protein